jgi:hypothetical protein
VIYIVLGLLFVVFGIVQLVFARQIHAYFERRNEGRSQWKQNPRGWSLAMTRFAGIVPILSGLFLIAFGMSQIGR